MTGFRTWFKCSLLVGFVALSQAASAQSTDPNHPTPWSGYGFNHRGNGRNVTYYYQVRSAPGTLLAHVHALAARNTTGLSVDFLDSSRNSVGRVSATASERAPQDQVGRINLTHYQNLLMAVHVDANAGEYSVYLDLPAAAPIQPARPEDHANVEALKAAAAGQLRSEPTPTPSTTWEMAGTGTGVNQDFYYPVTLYPGDFNLAVTCQARVFSTSVSLDLEDNNGISLRRVGAIATSNPVTERGTWHITTRQTARVHVHVDGNCGTFNWSMVGPVEH